MKSFVIACGGTGGHLSPGIAVAQELLKRGYRTQLLISRKRVDSRLSSKYPDMDFVPTPGAPFRFSPSGLLRFIITQTQSLFFNFRLLKKRKPHAVLAFGGFTTLGTVISARILRIPVAIHEANRKPGKAVVQLRHFADRIYLPDGVKLPGVSRKIIKHLGFPVRKEIKRIPRQKARQMLGIDVPGKLLLILGGSQGAESLNRWAREHMSRLGSEGISLFCITGMDKGAEGVFEMRNEEGSPPVKAWFVPFTDQMAEVLSAADLVISRAGAGSIAEMAHCDLQPP